MTPFETTAIRCDGNRLFALDQRKLPEVESWIDITQPSRTIDAIRTLSVRGAPLIGVTAAACLGIVSDHSNFVETANRIREARPTAVNLSWAVDRLLRVHRDGGSVSDEAYRILKEDCELCNRIAENGARLIDDGASIVTHCNTGGLATAGVGTALGVIKRAHAQGKKIHVFVGETRPLLQGARLTTWELKKESIPYTVICDSMAASLMKDKRITSAIVGADRIARNGDFANKVGTYALAVSCRFHDVPFYVAAPISTVDWNARAGSDIPIEMRLGDEIRAGEPCHNPSFDVTESRLVSRYILDLGIFTVQTFVGLQP